VPDFDAKYFDSATDMFVAVKATSSCLS